jgi:hypothetical protein
MDLIPAFMLSNKFKGTDYKYGKKVWINVGNFVEEK